MPPILNPMAAFRTEATNENPIPDAAFILGLVYLEAGLNPDAALRSAMADCTCSFPDLQMESV